MLVTKCKGERSFSKLKLILSYLRNSIGQKTLAPLAVLLIESQLLGGIGFSFVIDIFVEDKASASEFSSQSFLIVTYFIIILYFVKRFFQ